MRGTNVGGQRSVHASLEIRIKKQSRGIGGASVGRTEERRYGQVASDSRLQSYADSALAAAAANEDVCQY